MCVFGDGRRVHDYRAFNDVHIWASSGIRANCRSHSANKVTWSSVDTRSLILASHCSDNSIIAPTGDAFVPWMGLAVSETRAALAGGDHYREMAAQLRGLAHRGTPPNREFFAALQGIKSGDQGCFRRDQGIPPSSAIWRSPLVTNPIIGAVGRVAPARVQRAHRRWGIEGSNRLPPAARPLRT